jgi:hypothetical protein
LVSADPGYTVIRRGVQVLQFGTEAQMNHSFYSADRTTHVKIVVIALMFATAVAGIRIAVHSGGGDGLEQTRNVSPTRAGKPAMFASGIQVAVH